MLNCEVMIGASMEIDYSPYIYVLPDGSIWWRLEDAVKLGAGYLPVRENDRNLIPVLRAQNNLVRANERNLLSEFSQAHYTEAHPRLVMRDDGRYVEAHEFLEWLSRHISIAQSAIPFPDDLCRAVRLAVGPPVARTLAGYESLSGALEGYFDKPFGELPDAQRERVERDFFPIPWDSVTPDQRRYRAAEWDYQHDPATEQEREFWWQFFLRKDAIEEQIKKWTAVATPTAADLAQQETRLAALERELANMQKEEKQPYRNPADRERNLHERHASKTAHSAERLEYIAYPKAMKLLADRLGATPEELAAWLFFGSGAGLGGLTAYLNANELDSPPRFHYSPGGEGDFDYLSQLMGCWFIAEEIANFQPIERYITGKTLIDRWSRQPGIQPEAYILAKIRESRLMDFHPTYGGTEVSFPFAESFPPLETALFSLTHVKEIEASDFGCDENNRSADIKPALHLNHDSQLQQIANKRDEASTIGADQGVSVSPCAAFLAIKNLTADEVSIAFIGDKAESGLGANNMLEISARGVTRRVALAALDLVDRRRGGLNSQGIILLGMAQKEKLMRTDPHAAKMTRLRKVFRKHLGINDDPFEAYRGVAGWVPRFSIVDKRGAADERAKQEAERRTYSLDQFNEFADRFAGADQSHQSLDSDDSENDDADEWLKNNDTDAPHDNSDLS